MKRLTKWVFSQSLFRAYLLYNDHDGPMLADSITYRALFSVFASVLLGFSAAGLWFGGNPEAMQALSAALNQVIPGIGDVIDTDAISQPVSLTLTGIISLGGLVAAAVGAARSMRSALHQISDNEFQTAPFIPVFLRDLGVAVGIGLLVGLAALGSFATSLGLGNIAHLLGASESSAAFNLVGRTAGALVIFGIDILAMALIFTLLSGMDAPNRFLWKGSALGAFGLLILQEFSGLFVSGATSNPLLVSFAALVVLLLWMNLSAQVILIASTWIILETWGEAGDVRSLKDAGNMDDWKVMAAKANVASAEMSLERTEKNVAKAQAKRREAIEHLKAHSRHQPSSEQPSENAATTPEK